MTEPVPAEAITAATGAFNKAWLTRNQYHPAFAEKSVRDVLTAAAPAIRAQAAAAERKRIIARLRVRALDRAWTQDLHAGERRTESAIADLLGGDTPDASISG